MDRKEDEQQPKMLRVRYTEIPTQQPETVSVRAILIDPARDVHAHIQSALDILTRDTAPTAEELTTVRRELGLALATINAHWRVAK